MALYSGGDCGVESAIQAPPDSVQPGGLAVPWSSS
jgi:hypothetical protein